MNAEANYSVITRMDLLSYAPAAEQTRLSIQSFIDDGNEFAFTENIVQQTIAIRRSVKIKLPDAIIAAAAIVHGLTLLSDNDTVFLRVPRSKYVNPAKL